MEKGCLPLVHRGQQLAPIGEVLVHERPADARPLGHRLHRDRIGVARDDEVDGGVEECVAPVPSAQAPGFDGLVGRLQRGCRRPRHGVILSPLR
jgi:hypothetical protein